MDFAFDLPLTINGKHVADVEMIATLVRGQEIGDWHVGLLEAVAIADGAIIQTPLRAPHASETSFEAQCYFQAMHLVEQGALAERASQAFFEQNPDWMPSNDEHRLRSYELI